MKKKTIRLISLLITLVVLTSIVLAGYCIVYYPQIAAQGVITVSLIFLVLAIWEMIADTMETRIVRKARKKLDEEDEWGQY